MLFKDAQKLTDTQLSIGNLVPFLRSLYKGFVMSVIRVQTSCNSWLNQASDEAHPHYWVPLNLLLL